MKYKKESVIKMLENNNIPTTEIELMILALENDLIKREDPEPRARGRPRKYPLKEVDPDKVVDPKYHRLRTIRTNPTTIKLTNVDTGIVTTYDSLYKAYQETRHGCGYFMRNNGKVIDGIRIEGTRSSEKLIQV